MLTTVKAAGTTGSKCVVYGSVAEFKGEIQTTYTVRWCDAERELALLLPDTPLAATITWLPFQSNGAQRGQAVAVLSYPFWIDRNPIGAGSAEHSYHFHYESQCSIAAYIGNRFELLDRATDPGRFGSPVLNASHELVGLVFANHQAGDYFGEPTSLVTLTGPLTRKIIDEVETQNE